MPGHDIRLRIAWTCHVDGSTHRLDLPTSALLLPDSPFVLERRYRFPRRPAGESILLVIDHMPGLLEVSVNDCEWSPERSLPASGHLRLRVDPLAARSDSVNPYGWGDVRLRVQSTQVAGSPSEPLS